MKFTPCWWLPNGHLQTSAPTLLPAKKPHKIHFEFIKLADDDLLELCWLDIHLAENAPILLLLHGLEGSIHSPYIQGMLEVAKKHQWRAVVLHLRGSNGRINAISQSYHAGKTDDLETALQHIKSRYPHAPCVAVGYSLGGNQLLKFLGENPAQSLLIAAVAVSVPFDLEATCRHMHQGINRIYEQRFVKKLKYGIACKLKLNMDMPVTLEELNKIKTLYDFDDLVTAPLHGFKDAKDYYQRCSSQNFLSTINTPTLIIQAEDDPLIPKNVIPTIQQVSAKVELDIQKQGGHVGFISGGTPWNPKFWLEIRIMEYVQMVMAVLPLTRR